MTICVCVCVCECAHVCVFVCGNKYAIFTSAWVTILKFKYLISRQGENLEITKGSTNKLWLSVKHNVFLKGA